VKRLDLPDLIVIAGRVLDLDPDEVPAVADLEAAAEVLAEANRCQVLQWSAATLLHGLATRRPFGYRSTEVALLAALQLLGLNLYPVDDLGPPRAVRTLLERTAASAADVDELAAWLYGLLPGTSWPTGPLQLGRHRRPRWRPNRGEEGSGMMFERFTDRARRVVVLAQEEARLLNHDYIGTEHLLLGLIREREGVAAKALESLGVSLEAVRIEVEAIIGRSVSAPGGHIPFTPRTKKVLELSLREAKQLGHNYIGTEHILLGLIREREGVAAQVLVKLGADLPRVRQQVIKLLTGYAAEEATARTRLVRMTVPGDLRELEEQLAQVRRQKQAAIDAEDFDQASELRDREKQLLTGLTKREQEWTAGVDLAAVIQENRNLHREVERLRELLRQHGIEPDGGTAQTA
jgi:Clp amino terminal domain, pathogenicity island component/UvrB/uvrC motif